MLKQIFGHLLELYGMNPGYLLSVELFCYVTCPPYHPSCAIFPFGFFYNENRKKERKKEEEKRTQVHEHDLLSLDMHRNLPLNLLVGGISPRCL